MTKLKVADLPTDSLKPYDRNARTHSPKQIAQIAASIKAFGFNNPVLIDKDGGIIAGHGRVEAAKFLGSETVPCVRLEHLTDAQKRAYVLADNKLAEKAGWDPEICKHPAKTADPDQAAFACVVFQCHGSSSLMRLAG